MSLSEYFEEKKTVIKSLAAARTLSALLSGCAHMAGMEHEEYNVCMDPKKFLKQSEKKEISCKKSSFFLFKQLKSAATWDKNWSDSPSLSADDLNAVSAMPCTPIHLKKKKLFPLSAISNKIYR